MEEVAAEHKRVFGRIYSVNLLHRGGGQIFTISSSLTENENENETCGLRCVSTHPVGISIVLPGFNSIL